MTKTEFMKWAAQMVKNIDYKRYFTYIIPHDTKAIFCYDKKTGKIGLARCYPKDKFNRTIGKAIAYARCVGMEIPKINEEKYLAEMKFSDKFYAQYKCKKAEYVFLGKTPNVAHNEWLAFPVSDPNTLIHFSTPFDLYEMVE